MFSCKEDQMRDVEWQTARANKFCGVNTDRPRGRELHHCVLRSCSQFWLNDTVPCPDPVLWTKVQCVGKKGDVKLEYTQDTFVTKPDDTDTRLNKTECKAALPWSQVDDGKDPFAEILGSRKAGGDSEKRGKKSCFTSLVSSIH